MDRNLETERVLAECLRQMMLVSARLSCSGRVRKPGEPHEDDLDGVGCLVVHSMMPFRCYRKEG